MGVLDNFPFDFVVFDAELKVCYKSFKEESELDNLFSIESNYIDYFGEGSHFENSLENLLKSSVPFSEIKSIENKKYQLTHFFLSDLPDKGKFFGVFFRRVDSDKDFLSFDVLNQCFYLFFKMYMHEDDQDSFLEIEKVLNLHPDEFLIGLVKKIKSHQFNNKKQFRYAFNYLGIFYYLDALKHPMNKRKEFFNLISRDEAPSDFELKNMVLLQFLKDKGLPLNDVFTRLGKIFETEALEESVHYFCEISEYEPISINLGKTQELFSYLKEGANNLQRKYPFFYHRISVLEKDVFDSKVISKLKFWEKINNLFWRMVSNQ